MKKKTLLILAVLITALACLFTSCSASVEPPKAEEEFGFVTFGNGGSRTLNTEYGIKSYNDLYWYYTAVKQDGFGLTGQSPKDDNNNFIPQPVNATKNSAGNVTIHKGLSGEIGPLSQGAWVFTLYAYEEKTQTIGETTTTSKTLVYQGASSTIVLKGGETKAVPVSVELKGATGVIDLSRAYFNWANNSPAEGPIYVTVILGNNSPTILGPLSKGANGYQFGTSLLAVNGLTDITAGYYTCTINAYLASDVNADSKEVNIGATPVATQIMGLRVYGNATTYIKDNLVENPDTYVDFTVPQQSMVAFNQNQASVPSNPANAKDDQDKALPTTIDFGTNLDSNATHILTLEVADIETSSAKFSVEDNKSAVASLSFDLKAIGTNESGATTQTTVSTFESPVTVTTYIAKSLTSVQVKYNGTGTAPIATDDVSALNRSEAAELETDNGTALGYNPSTGLLRFMTDHFSEYYVVADEVVALNVTTNVGYNSLSNAINAANDGNTIYLLKNIESDSPFVSMTSGKTVNLDLRKHTLKYLGNYYSIGLFSGSKLHVSNGTVLMNCDPYYGIYAQSSSISLQNVSVYSSDSGIFTTGSISSVLLEDCYIESVYSAVYHNGSYAPANISITNSTLVCNSEDDDPCVYISNSSGRELQKLAIKESIITGPTAVEVKHTNVTIIDSTLNATEANVSYSESGNGSTTVGYCLALTGNGKADSTSGTVYLSGNTYNSANPGCEVFNSSAINGVNKGATINGYKNTHVLSPDKLMPVCRIQGTDTVYYSAYDLRDATAADLKNKTVVIQSDEVLSNEIYLSGKAFTLDLNGHFLQLEYGEDITPNNGSVIYVGGKNSKLTINDSSEGMTGAVYGSDQTYLENVTSAVRVGNYGKLIINGGNFYGRSKGTSCIFVCTSIASSTAASVTINGGYFETTLYNDTYYVLNHEDGATTGCKITVYGGRFRNYNPGVTLVDSGNAKTGKIVLGTGCTTTSETIGQDTFYTVNK